MPPTPRRSTAARAKTPICSRELLRAHGYYDALVDTVVEAGAGANTVQVTLNVQPGPLYRFAEVSLPGLDERPARTPPRCATAFGVDPNDPVDATKVATGEAALRIELGRRGYAFAEVGEIDIAVDHETAHRDPDPAGPARRRAPLRQDHRRGRPAVQRQAYRDDRALRAGRALSDAV